MDISNWITSGEAARRIGVSQAYINRLIHDGALRAVRTRLGYLIDPEAVEAFRAARETRKKPKPDNEPVDLALVT